MSKADRERLEDLERRVKELEARPPVLLPCYYPMPAPPVYVPAPYPYIPSPWITPTSPWWTGPIWSSGTATTCDSGAASTDTIRILAFN